jgi:transcriptional regulator with XRE-family HTH domain
MIKPCQLRAARALVGMSQHELAERSGVGITTIKRFELANGQVARASTLEVLAKTLEEAGVIFLPEGRGNGPGVRLRSATTLSG